MHATRILGLSVLAALAVCALPSPTSAAPRASMAAEINSVRQAHGLRPLRLSGSLNRSSSRYARRLLRADWFGHASRIHASPRFRVLGEVLEMHRGRRARVRGALRAWLRSPGHRAVLLSPRFRWVGLGVDTGRFRGRTTTIWVGQFGR
jgi:uncharacterized protein YkwD